MRALHCQPGQGEWQLQGCCCPLLWAPWVPHSHTPVGIVGSLFPLVTNPWTPLDTGCQWSLLVTTHRHHRSLLATHPWAPLDLGHHRVPLHHPPIDLGATRPICPPFVPLPNHPRRPLILDLHFGHLDSLWPPSDLLSPRSTQTLLLTCWISGGRSVPGSSASPASSTGATT